MTRHHSNGKVTSENGNVSAAIHENLDKISGFAKREEAELTSLQRSIERISLFFSEPRAFY